MVAAVIVSIAMVPVVVLVRPTVPHYPVAVVVAPIASGFGAIVALFWLIRWPPIGAVLPCGQRLHRSRVPRTR
jgi:hypothetical protein